MAAWLTMGAANVAMIFSQARQLQGMAAWCEGGSTAGTGHSCIVNVGTSAQEHSGWDPPLSPALFPLAPAAAAAKERGARAADGAHLPAQCADALFGGCALSGMKIAAARALRCLIKVASSLQASFCVAGMHAVAVHSLPHTPSLLPSHPTYLPPCRALGFGAVPLCAAAVPGRGHCL